MDQPSPILDPALVAVLGLTMMSFASTSSKDSFREEAPVGVFEQGGDLDDVTTFTKTAEKIVDQEYAADVKGTFYCQAGDHIVDHIVWLETITLGCRPCMEKMGRAIGTDEWLPRLWAVGEKGAVRARPIPPVAKASVPLKSNTVWQCTTCKDTFPDSGQGFWNTKSGFICNRCQPTRKIGQDRESVRQRINRQNNERMQKIILRQSEQIERENRKDAEHNARRSEELYNQIVNPVRSPSPFRSLEESTPFRSLEAPTFPTAFPTFGEWNDQKTWNSEQGKWNDYSDADQAQHEAVVSRLKVNPERRTISMARMKQLAQIDNLKIIPNRDVDLCLGGRYKWLYVADEEQLYTWMGSHWREAPLPEPVVECEGGHVVGWGITVCQRCGKNIRG